MLTTTREQVSRASDRSYLVALGERIREIRARRGMSRKILARDSGLSLRYLAKLELGEANISILLLRQLSGALDTPIEILTLDGPDPPLELTHSIELLRRLPQDGVAQAHKLLIEAFGSIAPGDRRNRIALIGLRGAGKSTLGARLAKRLACPFIELDKEVEHEAGLPLTAIFDLYGQAGFRRLERQSLDRVIETSPHAVIATGGGIVSDAATFDRLLSACFTIWIKAAPVEHMERVIAQGDMRPMADNRAAMADLRRILKTRESLYRRADVQVNTSGQAVDESLESLVAALS